MALLGFSSGSYLQKTACFTVTAVQLADRSGGLTDAFTSVDFPLCGGGPRVPAPLTTWVLVDLTVLKVKLYQQESWVHGERKRELRGGPKNQL